MAIPTSPTWDLADFNASTIGSLLTLGPAEVNITPTVTPYFSYTPDFRTLIGRSDDRATARIDLIVPIPNRFTIEFVARFPFMPHDVGDLAAARAGFTIADDAGRGVSIYFASTGLAVSRVDDFGSVTALPDTADTTREFETGFKTVRVAVDSGLGRAYVYIGDGDTTTPSFRYIVPVEATPATVPDTFAFFLLGDPAQPAQVELRRLQLAADLLIPNFPPIADAGPDRVAPVGQAVRFDGRASYDIEGAPLLYEWKLTDAPTGSTYATDQSSGNTVDDGDADAVTDTLSFPASALPAWVAPGDVLRIASTRHEIATVDNPGGSLTVTTDTIPDSLTDAPFRIFRQSLLVGHTTETPYAVPDIQGIYRFALTVNDGEIDSEESEVLANIVGARTTFGVEPDVSDLWKALGDEWKFIENRGVFEEAWRGVAQILGGKLLEAWQYHYNYSIRDAQPTFQRKWIPFRTLVTETAPDDATTGLRYGALQATHEFEIGDPAVTGQTLIFEYHTGVTPTEVATVTVTLTGDTLATIISDTTAALSGTGITPYTLARYEDSATFYYEAADGSTVDDGDGNRVTATFSFTATSLPSWVAAGDTLVVGGNRYQIATVNNPGGSLTVTTESIPDNLSAASFRIWRHSRLGFKSTTRGFRILSTSTAATTLGLTTDQYNYLEGTNGARVTDRTYVAGDGISFSEMGVTRGDLLVLNNGQSFRVDKVISGPLDPLDGQRVLLFEELPFDATPEWELPSLIVSTEVDYEFEGVYPGDLVKFEAYRISTDTVYDVQGTVRAQKGMTVVGRFDGLYGVFADSTAYELRLLGVKRRKALPLPSDPDEVLSVPQLQDLIPASAGPTLWMENVDYILEPFYRELDESGIPMLQFRDSVFIDPDLEPPDIFWAELVLFSNELNVENTFGRLASFLRDDASTFDDDFNYTAGVAGLLYSQQRGPRVSAMRIGAQILLGQSFAEVDGIITEVRTDFSPTRGRLIIQDDDGNDPTRSEIFRTYFYTKDPLDLTATSGLEINPATNAAWAVGDSIPQFSPIGSGVRIVDIYNDPDAWIPYIRAGLITEVEKFHQFIVEFNLDLVSIANLSLLFQHITKVKPTYTHPFIVGFKAVEEDLDPIDDIAIIIQKNMYDIACGSGPAWMYDDYRGGVYTGGLPPTPVFTPDPPVWTSYDDGVAYYDALVDCPLDLIELCLDIAHADSAATLTGGEDISAATYPGDFGSRTLQLIIDGTTHNVVFSAGVANAAAVVSEINTAVGASVASLDANNALVITSNGTPGTTSFLGTNDGTSAGGATLTFTASSLPAWVGVNDEIYFEGVVAHIATVNNPGGSLTVTPPVLPAATSQTFRIWEPDTSVVIGAGTTAALFGVIGFYSGQEALGNAVDFDAILFFDTDVVDRSGVVAAAVDDTFTPTYDMNLPAGTYRVCVFTKSGGLVLP